MKKRRNEMMLVFVSTTMLATAAIAAEPAAPKAAPKAAAVDPHGAAAAPAAKIDWATMKFDARKKYMKATVLPEMKKVFAAFDPKGFANVTCATCHGKDAAEKKFKMPNPDLPKLPGPTDRAGFMAMAEKKPEVVKFMGTQVKPKMASLLGLAEWTPASPTGFACYNCHTHEEGAPAAAPAGAPAATKPGAAPKGAPAKPEPKGW
jgi:hypothetical protein